MNKAVFLDRDGVINKMIFDQEKNEYHPPFRKQDLVLYKGVTEALKELQENDFKLFLVSNQPDYAKGKTGLENLAEVHRVLNDRFVENGIFFTDYYYCYHHPDGVIKKYSYDCECRKPKNFFAIKAINDHNIDNNESWFIGDRDKDVECGRRSGMKTIRILSNYYEYKDSKEADHTAADLKEAVRIILTKNKN